jgi:integrase
MSSGHPVTEQESQPGTREGGPPGGGTAQDAAGGGMRGVVAARAGADADVPPPVEYAVAVQRFLAQASLSPASRRVYAISLAGWAWPLVGAPVPAAGQRRGAHPPAVPLVLLDAPGTPGRLAAAARRRARAAGVRTVNREVSALRSAAWWWLDQGWISSDPAAALRCRGQVPAPRLSAAQVAALFAVRASLREQALWRLIYDCGWPAGRVLALDASAVDLAARRVRGPVVPDTGSSVGLPAGLSALPVRPWRADTAELVTWLLAGRYSGPLFLTGRRAPAGTPPADICPVTGRARMSYRRAAEIFARWTQPLDPSGRGWTLHQLAAAS